MYHSTSVGGLEGGYGGNLDCAEITAGATVTLPVEAPGVGLYFGDGKAAIGAGEVVCAPEAGLRILAAATPVQRPASMSTPRVRSEQRLTTIVSARSLEDACRHAFRALKNWLEDEWRLTSDEAAIVMGIGAHCEVAQVSNPLHTGTCSIARSLLPGVGAYGAREAIRWTEHAAGAGAPVMALPPNSYRADERAVVAHYRAIAAVGLPVVAYNNPLDTKVDLTPEVLARLHGEGLIVAVKEFAGDPRRAYAVRELAPDLDMLIGSDDTVLKVALAGAK